MFNKDALISNAFLEAKIAANNKANEQLQIVCNQPWAKNLPMLTRMNQHVARADIEISFSGDFEEIWAAVPNKVNVYNLSCGCGDSDRSPDYDGDKLEKLLTRYTDHKADDFSCANVQMEFKPDTPSAMMMFYSLVDGIKVCWKVAIANDEYRAKYADLRIDDVTYSNGDYYALLDI